MQANDNSAKLRHSDVNNEVKAEHNTTKTISNVKNGDGESCNVSSPAVKIRRTLVMDNNSKILRSNNNENGLKNNSINNCVTNIDVNDSNTNNDDVLELLYNTNVENDKANVKKDQIENKGKEEKYIIEENLLNYFYKLLRKKNQFNKEEKVDLKKEKQLSQQQSQKQKEEQEEEEDKNFHAEMDACFTAFDKDGDDRLSICEFALICRALFRNDRGHIYEVSKEWLDQMFEVFDQNGDGHIDREEFQFCWNNWIKAIVRPVNAFLVVDVQNDFISGSLDISNCSAQQNGVEIVEPINNLLDTVDFDAVFYSLDWHPSDHVSFIDNVKKRPLDETSPIDADSAQVYDTVIFAGPPPMKQRLWPRHCVQDSWGAELHKDLKIVEDGIKVYKGTNPEVDSYSVFWDNKKLSETTLNDQLKMKGTTDIYVCGLAYDVCVGATAVDALSAGYRTILLDDCCRGVDLNDIENTKEKVNSSHGVIVHSNEVKAMVEGRDRRPELGYKLAMELKNPESVLATRNNGVRRSI